MRIGASEEHMQASPATTGLAVVDSAGHDAFLSQAQGLCCSVLWSCPQGCEDHVPIASSSGHLVRRVAAPEVQGCEVLGIWSGHWVDSSGLGQGQSSMMAGLGLLSRPRTGRKLE